MVAVAAIEAGWDFFVTPKHVLRIVLESTMESASTALAGVQKASVGLHVKFQLVGKPA